MTGANRRAVLLSRATVGNESPNTRKCRHKWPARIICCRDYTAGQPVNTTGQGRPADPVFGPRPQISADFPRKMALPRGSQLLAPSPEHPPPNSLTPDGDPAC